METEVLKILICGDVKGNLQAIYKRVFRAEKKAGKFDMLFCVGDFFGNKYEEISKFINGESPVPIATYVISPLLSQKDVDLVRDIDGNDICSNLVYLGRRGVYTLSNGLKVAYLSGACQAKSFSSDDTVLLRARSFIEADGSAVVLQSRCGEPDFVGVDLFLSSSWPRDVHLQGGTLPPKCDSEGTECPSGTGEEIVARLAAQLRPRYHFSALREVFYERLPYRNHRVGVERDRHVTRFVGLGAVTCGGTETHRFIYAVKLRPLASMPQAELVAQPAGLTDFPYRGLLERVGSTIGSQEDMQQFFFDDTSSASRTSRRRSKSNGPTEDAAVTDRDPKRPRVYAPCWFCLGNPKVERHLVVSVGEYSYLALPRGGIVPDHVLIMPVEHQQSWVNCPDEVCAEMTRYKQALSQMYRQMNKTMIVFERNFKSHHLILQVVPIPFELAAEAKQVFYDFARKQEPPLVLHSCSALKSDLKDILAPHLPYMSIELPHGQRLYTRILKNQHSNFPIQFGRAVLVSPDLLNCPDREDWRACVLEHQEEVDLATLFRRNFAPYDFTIQ